MELSGHMDLNRLQPSLEQDLQGLRREEVIKDAIRDAQMTGCDSFFIESGAGAGKTTVLARRILSLLEGGARPAQFAILTYTREAADELRYKISKYGPTWEMRISTVHSFGRSVLSAFVHEEINLRALDDHQILERLLNLLRSRSDVLEQLRSKYKYIFMDEFQDADRVIMSLLRLLATGNTAAGDESLLRDGALFVVGDPRQSIYHLQGETCDAFAQMRSWMLEQRSRGALVNVVAFRLNFRADQPVLDYINERFGRLIPDYVDMQAGRKSVFPVQGVHHLSCANVSKAEEAERVGRCILRLLEQNRTLNFRNYMVLTWNQAERDIYTCVLEGMGIRTDDCSRTEADRSNVVRVMDIYEAKGLAGDIVLVACDEALRDMDVYQARQLEYVAATRARHALIYAGMASRER